MNTSHLQLFLCEKLSCKLTRKSCGRRWQFAASLRPGITNDLTKAATFAEVYYRPCQGCPIGEENANNASPIQINSKTKYLAQNMRPVKSA